MYVTDVRCQTKASLNAPPIGGGGMISGWSFNDTFCAKKLCHVREIKSLLIMLILES